MNEDNPWKTKETTVPYENNWIRVEHNEVITPSGSRGIYGVVHYKNLAIGVIPIDKNLNTWIVGQYRYPGKFYSWEIPEGGGDLAGDPINSAKRELKEETGIVANKWQIIQKTHLSNSVSDEKGVVYLATDLTFTESTPEETEQLQIKKLPFETFYQMVANGEITDSLSVMAAYRIKLMLLEGLLKI
ncbi:MAG: NUDIX domain-containing protein [Flavobacteriales bacterium]